MSNGEPLRPLDFMRAVLADEDLTTAERLFLVAVALSADNATREVRRSLASLALMTKVRGGTVSAMLKRDRVLRYVHVKNRSRRRVDLRVKVPQPSTQPSEPDAAKVPQPSTQSASTVNSDGLNRKPSALSALSSASTDEPMSEGPVPDALCFEPDCGKVGCDGECVEPVKVESVGKVKPCGCDDAMRCYECNPAPEMTAKEAERRRKAQAYDYREQGLDENGEPKPKRERRQGSVFTST